MGQALEKIKQNKIQAGLDHENCSRDRLIIKQKKYLAPKKSEISLQNQKIEEYKNKL